MSAMALFGRMCRFYGALIMPHRYVTVRHAGGNGLRSHLCGIELCPEVFSPNGYRDQDSRGKARQSDERLYHILNVPARDGSVRLRSRHRARRGMAYDGLPTPAYVSNDRWTRHSQLRSLA